MTELTSYHRKGYGSNTFERVPPDPERCAEMVSDRDTRWPRFHQCRFKRGYGPEGAFCKIHDPEAKRRRDAEKEARWKREHRARMRGACGPKFLDALRRIADGHNDPRGLAREIVDEFDDRYGKEEEN